jgi:hypothetical protein
MKTVAKIIETYRGLEWLRQSENYIRLENPPFMRLVIEHIGEGPRGMPAISVAHYYEQAGDLVSFRQDNAGLYREAVFVSDEGQVMVRPQLLRQLKAFACGWDRNIRQQGFLKVAVAQCAAGERKAP